MRPASVVVALTALLVSHGAAHAQCGSPPTCFGQPATIYVAAGIICGGPKICGRTPARLTEPAPKT